VRYILEIADADFYVGSYSIGDRTRFLESDAITNVPLYDSTCERNFRSDELNNVLKMLTKFAAKYQGNCTYRSKYWRLWKGEFGTKTRTYLLELVQELDKEGIERLRISSLSLIY
jgi:threonylcarbamoyladenosine tRNA methylthiotransferase MtaB